MYRLFTLIVVILLLLFFFLSEKNDNYNEVYCKDVNFQYFFITCPKIMNYNLNLLLLAFF